MEETWNVIKLLIFNVNGWLERRDFETHRCKKDCKTSLQEASLLLETRNSTQNLSWIDSSNTGNTSIRIFILLETAVEHNTQVHRNPGFVDSGVHSFLVIISESSSSLIGILKVLC